MSESDFIAPEINQTSNFVVAPLPPLQYTRKYVNCTRSGATVRILTTLIYHSVPFYSLNFTGPLCRCSTASTHIRIVT